MAAAVGALLHGVAKGEDGDAPHAEQIWNGRRVCAEMTRNARFIALGVATFAAPSLVAFTSLGVTTYIASNYHPLTLLATLPASYLLTEKTSIFFIDWFDSGLKPPEKED